ncbi:DUF2306 domain-containing protein [Piscinibacter sakaiensis]|uniref:Putative membrane protein n=1 Tax=Piscinibacter sakaiensis TaxID=1547922 RepID=A0A0K8P8Z7_PISS1|nr:DUF2306 domain-containing protein [Piscinibacter sakaiensis]GAP38989.1 putative membrane protein [Piscinibacter sakaiensis]
MYLGPDLSSQPPAVIVHLVVAVGALVVGPVALFLRKGSRWHRAVGYGWVTLMLGAALSSAFIRDFRLPNVSGYTAIHALTVATFVGIGLGLWHISRRNVVRHRRVMQWTYGAALLAGAFALRPERYLGGLLWHHALGLV